MEIVTVMMIISEIHMYNVDLNVLWVQSVLQIRHVSEIIVLILVQIMSAHQMPFVLFIIMFQIVTVQIIWLVNILTLTVNNPFLNESILLKNKVIHLYNAVFKIGPFHKIHVILHLVAKMLNVCKDRTVNQYAHVYKTWSVPLHHVAQNVSLVQNVKCQKHVKIINV